MALSIYMYASKTENYIIKIYKNIPVEKKSFVGVLWNEVQVS